MAASVSTMGRRNDAALGLQALCWLLLISPVVNTEEFPENLVVTTLSAGNYHTCAIRRDDRRLFCWGQNVDGQSDVPAGLGRVAQVAAGGFHTCAIAEAAMQVVCWGWDFASQVTVPASVGVAAAIATGFEHSCAVREVDGTIVCWGSNLNGQSAVPLGLGAAMQVSAGYFHTCAIVATDSSLLCWGKNAEQQTDVPAGLGPVILAVLGNHHTCAVLEVDSTLTCWGNTVYGSGTTTAVAGASAFNTHTCAISADSNGVVCQGLDGRGQLDVPSTLGRVAGVSAGGFHTCAIREADRHLVCWGLNEDGQADPPAELGEVAEPATPTEDLEFTTTWTDLETTEDAAKDFEELEAVMHTSVLALESIDLGLGVVLDTTSGLETTTDVEEELQDGVLGTSTTFSTWADMQSTSVEQLEVGTTPIDQEFGNEEVSTTGFLLRTSASHLPLDSSVAASTTGVDTGLLPSTLGSQRPLDSNLAGSTTGASQVDSGGTTTSGMGQKESTSTVGEGGVTLTEESTTNPVDTTRRAPPERQDLLHIDVTDSGAREPVAVLWRCILTLVVCWVVPSLW